MVIIFVLLFVFARVDGNTCMDVGPENKSDAIKREKGPTRRRRRREM